MKLLHIINSLDTGGAEKLIAETLSLYVKEGISVDLLLLNGSKHPLLKELSDKKCCRIFSLGNSSLYHPKYIFKIIPFLKKYDLIHVHLFPAQYYVVLAEFLSGSKVKLIFTEHSTSNRRMSYSFLKKFDSFFYKSYTKIIAISEAVKSALSKYLESEDKIIVIENGVNLENVYEATRSREIDVLFPDENARILLHVGGFRIEKDQDTTIRSLLHLPANYHLLLVGEGIRKEQLSDLVIQHSLQNRVHFLGRRIDVFSILKSVDFAVVSSHWEGFGLFAVEAMAANKPLIASDVPGVRQVVENAGILFPAGDEKQLAKEILHLSNDAEHYADTVEKCKARAKEYDISKMVDAHVKLYKDLLSIH